MSDKVCKQTSDCFRHAFHLLTAVGCDVLLALESASRFAYIPRRAGSLQRNGHVYSSRNVRITLRCLVLVYTFPFFMPLPYVVILIFIILFTQHILSMHMYDVTELVYLI